MDRRFAFCHAFLIFLIAFHEFVVVAPVVVAQGAAGLYVEHAFGTVLDGYLLGNLQQGVGLFGAVVECHIDDIHIDGGHAGDVAVFLHQAKHLAPVVFRLFLVTTVTVDMALHVHCHIHLLIDLLLAQFLRELTCQFVGLVDALLVHLEHDLIAALGIVAMQVIFIVQVFLKCLYGRKELGAVAVVESAVHSVVELFIGLVVRVVNSLCQDRIVTE